MIVMHMHAMAMQTNQIPFDALADADIAFSGICLSKSVYALKKRVFGQSVSVFQYTFQVANKDVLKGQVTDTFSFLQAGSSKGSAQMLTVPGMPDYEIGTQYLLFLSSESRLGLRAPMGVFQGQFKVISDDTGHRFISATAKQRHMVNAFTTQTNSAAKHLSSQHSNQSHIVDFNDIKRAFLSLQKDEQ